MQGQVITPINVTGGPQKGQRNAEEAFDEGNKRRHEDRPRDRGSSLKRRGGEKVRVLCLQFIRMVVIAAGPEDAGRNLGTKKLHQATSLAFSCIMDERQAPDDL